MISRQIPFCRALWSNEVLWVQNRVTNLAVAVLNSGLTWIDFTSHHFSTSVAMHAKTRALLVEEAIPITTMGHYPGRRSGVQLSGRKSRWNSTWGKSRTSAFVENVSVILCHCVDICTGVLVESSQGWLPRVYYWWEFVTEFRHILALPYKNRVLLQPICEVTETVSASWYFAKTARGRGCASVYSSRFPRSGLRDLRTLSKFSLGPLESLPRLDMYGLHHFASCSLSKQYQLMLCAAHGACTNVRRYTSRCRLAAYYMWRRKFNKTAPNADRWVH